MRSLDDLLEEAKTGTLTDEEISYIVEKIKNHQKGIDVKEDLYTLIYAIGIADCIAIPGKTYSPARGTEYRDIIESFLNYPNDPSVASIALKSLCTYWRYTESYLDEIKYFIKGVDWDEHDDVFLASVRIAGEYLRESNDKNQELLELLIEKWEENEKKDISSTKTEAVYEALARASGQQWSQVLSSKKPDSSVLQSVYKMCHRNYS